MNNRYRHDARLIAMLIIAIALLGCGSRKTAADPGASPDPRTATITPDALRQRLQSGGDAPLVVDVREPHEFKDVHIDGARLAPLGTVVRDLGAVEKEREIVLVCRSGNRSGKAQKLLAARGYTNLRNMEGGMLAWERRGHPVVRNR